MRENRRNLDAAYAHKKKNKEYKLDFNETIKAIADLLEECYGVTFYELCRETTMSKLAHREVKPEDVAWRRMLESREDLRKYVAKVVDTGELYAPPTSHIWSYMAVCDQNDSTETCLGLDSVRAKLSMVLIRPLATIRAMACNFWVTLQVFR